MSTKNVAQTKTSYNFLQEHSDEVQHNINPNKGIARQTDSNIGAKSRFDEDQAVLSGSPKKKNWSRDQHIRTSDNDGYSVSHTHS